MGRHTWPREVSGPLARYEKRFSAALRRQGYQAGAVTNQVQLVAHLSRWLERRRLSEAELTGNLVDLYVADRKTERQRLHCSAKALEPLLAFLRGLDRLPAEAETGLTSPLERLLGEYAGYLRDDRGLAPLTIRGYLIEVRPFLAQRVERRGPGLATLTVGDVTRFVSTEAKRRGRGSFLHMVTALRSVLRWLHVDGRVAESLVEAVPVIPSYRLSSLPKGLDQDDVDRLLASCDLDTVTGRRDFALLKLLVRLGLRAGEVAALKLDDIDWGRGQIAVTGKSRRREWLPLPEDCGRALAEYLVRGRPRRALERSVFIRVIPPHHGLSVRGVAMAVLAAGRRAGFAHDLRPHRLRHTAATLMLRNGAGLREIGQVLRHRSLMTTAIYAKVDRQALRQLAIRWPAGPA